MIPGNVSSYKQTKNVVERKWNECGTGVEREGTGEGTGEWGGAELGSLNE